MYQNEVSDSAQDAISSISSTDTWDIIAFDLQGFLSATNIILISSDQAEILYRHIPSHPNPLHTLAFSTDPRKADEPAALEKFAYDIYILKILRYKRFAQHFRFMLSKQNPVIWQPISIRRIPPF